MATQTPTSSWPFPTGLGAQAPAISSAKAPVPAAKPSAKVAKKRLPTNHRAAWDAAADNQLIVGYLAGMTPAALAKACGRTKASVAGRLHALGLLIFDKDKLVYSTAPKVWFKVQVA